VAVGARARQLEIAWPGAGCSSSPAMRSAADETGCAGEDVPSASRPTSNGTGLFIISLDTGGARSAIWYNWRVLSARIIYIAVSLAAMTPAPAQPAAQADAGKTLFTERCAVCHGVNATGGTLATSILPRIAALDDAGLENAITNGLPARGMPPMAMPKTE